MQYAMGCIETTKNNNQFKTLQYSKVTNLLRHYFGESLSKFHETEAKIIYCRYLILSFFLKNNNAGCSRINVIKSMVHQCSSKHFFGAYLSKVVTLSSQVNFLLSEQGVSCLLMDAIAPYSNYHPQKFIVSPDYIFLKKLTSSALPDDFVSILHNSHHTMKSTKIF